MLHFPQFFTALQIECFLNFEYPLTRQFVLFKEAKIGHLEIRKVNILTLFAIFLRFEVERV